MGVEAAREPSAITSSVGESVRSRGGLLSNYLVNPRLERVSTQT